MENIKIEEESKSLKLQGLEDITVIDHAFEHEYRENYHYYIIYKKDENGKIVNLIGFPHEIETIFVPNIEKYGAAKVNINQEQYEILKYSFDSKDLLTFYDENKDEIFYRRLKIEILKGKFDKNEFAFYDDDNIIIIKVHALDSNDNIDDDIKELHFKKLRIGGDISPITDATVYLIKEDQDGNQDEIKINSRKAKISNPSIIKIDLNNSSQPYAYLRFKAYVPNLSNFWLSIYLKAKKVEISEEEDLT